MPRICSRAGVIAALILTFFAANAVSVHYRVTSPKERSDFPVYQAAGEAVLEGGDIYEARSGRGWYFTGLPLLAAASVPFAMMPVGLAAMVFYLLSVAALLHAAWIAARLAEEAAGPTRHGQVGTFLGALLLTLWPWLSGLNRGQVSVPLVWFVMVAIDRFARDREQVLSFLLGGVAVGAAVVMKAFPGLLVVWLLARRRFKPLAAATLGVLLLLGPAPALVFGWEGNAERFARWVTTVASPLKQTTQEGHLRYGQMLDPRIDKNQSVQAVAVRLVAPAEEAGRDDPRERAARALAIAVNLTILGATAAGIVRSERRIRLGAADPREQRIRQAAAVVLVSLFVAPLTWTHYYTAALLPAAIAGAAAFGGATRGPWRRRYAAAVLIWVAGFVGALYDPIYYAGSQLFGGLAVWGVLAWHLFAADEPAAQPTPCSHLANSK